MRCAIYARVSSANQRDRQTIDSQLRVLPEFVARQGWLLVGAPYVDDGRSAKAGSLAARTGLAALLRDAGAGLFDVVAVVDVDRLTRSEDLVERGQILGALQRAGVKVAAVSTGQLIDFSSSMGDLLGSLGAFFAAEWTRKHRMRVVEGKLTAIARGKKPAGPTPYGYRYDRATGVWSVFEPEAAIVREIFERTLCDETATSIANDLHARAVPRPHGGEWIRERIYAVLRQPAYRGEWIADKARKLTVPTPRIISDADWYGVRDRAAAAARQLRGLRRTKYFYLCEDLATCGLCGGRVGIASKPKRPTVTPARYVCNQRRHPRRDVARCGGPYWPVPEVDERVWAALTRFVLRDDLVDRVLQRRRAAAGGEAAAWAKDIPAAEKRLARLAEAEAAILARFRRGLVTQAALDTELEAFARDRAVAHEQLEATRRAQVAAGASDDASTRLEALVAALRGRLASATPETKRQLMRLLVKPGGVRLSVARIEVAVRLSAAPAQPPRGGLVAVSDWNEVDEANVLFRLVA